MEKEWIKCHRENEYLTTVLLLNFLKRFWKGKYLQKASFEKNAVFQNQIMNLSITGEIQEQFSKTLRIKRKSHWPWEKKILR